MKLIPKWFQFSSTFGGYWDPTRNLSVTHLAPHSSVRPFIRHYKREKLFYFFSLFSLERVGNHCWMRLLRSTYVCCQSRLDRMSGFTIDVIFSIHFYGVTTTFDEWKMCSAHTKKERWFRVTFANMTVTSVSHSVKGRRTRAGWNGKLAGRREEKLQICTEQRY